MALWSTQLNSYVFVAVVALWVAFLHQAKWNVAKLLYVSARYMPGLMAPLLIVSNQAFIVEDVDCQILGNLALGTAYNYQNCCCYPDTTISSLQHNNVIRRRIHLSASNLRHVVDQILHTLRSAHIHSWQDRFIPDVSACKSFGQPLLWAIILEFLVLELALIILTVLRCTKNRGSTLEPLLVILLQHNIFYYSCGFLLSVVNALCMWRLHVDIDTFGLDNEAFEHNYRVDVTDGKNSFLPNTLQIGVDGSSLELQMKLDEEYNELLNDRRLLREFAFPTADGLTPHYLPVNLHRIIQNATEQIRR
ncbi:hypothetical protein AZE42_05538 [Rhizopogon vesiculosus]|uniref:RNA polymerase Rpb1 domain-containing protein n=1 Tax=Rhizopogon vesiculosus TaxID=180088 RepID=A0A1J8R5G2_9AGAM|nr:hypothetical protein AZE42_05538 [Rhizopogon vesiculosus]